MKQNHVKFRAEVISSDAFLTAVDAAAMDLFRAVRPSPRHDVRAAVYANALIDVLIQLAETEGTRRALRSGERAKASQRRKQRLRASGEYRRLTRRLTRTGLPALYLSLAFESLYGREPEIANLRNITANSPGAKTNARRRHGVFFTPPDLARAVVTRAVGPILKRCQTLDELTALRIVDPSSGAGVFLLEALKLFLGRGEELNAGPLLSQTRIEIACACIRGVDLDPHAAKIARFMLWLELGEMDLAVGDLERSIVVADALAPIRAPMAPEEVTENEHCWDQFFADVFSSSSSGFDAVIGNPPWGRIRPDVKRFHSLLDVEVKNRQGESLRDFLADASDAGNGQWMHPKWVQHSSNVKRYASYLKGRRDFVAQRVHVGARRTGHDSDLYKYFLEQSFNLLKPDGRLGLVLPGAIRKTEGAAGLRRLLFANGKIDELLEFENRERVFPIHGMFRFLILIFQRGTRGGINNARFGLVSVKQLDESNVSAASAPQLSLSRDFLRATSGALLVVPEVRTECERDLLERLHQTHPPLGDVSAGNWSVRFRRELDMTADSHLFVDALHYAKMKGAGSIVNGWRTGSGEEFLPLMEGRMVHQFDPAAKAYVSGAGRAALWEPTMEGEKRVRPHYLVKLSTARNRPGVRLVPRAGFCDVTGHANERSVLAALIPATAICGNKVPTCEFSDDQDVGLHLLWLALANSFIVDWLVRRRLSTTLNFFVWKQIPFPRLDPRQSQALGLIECAARLSCHSDEDVKWIGKALQHSRITLTTNLAVPTLVDRSLLRSRIDATVARLYEVSFEELRTLFDDFPLTDRAQYAHSAHAVRSLPPELRRGVTKDLVSLDFLSVSGGRQKKQRREEVSQIERRIRAATDNGAVGYLSKELIGAVPIPPYHKSPSSHKTSASSKGSEEQAASS